MRNPDPFPRISYTVLFLLVVSIPACLDRPTFQKCGNGLCPVGWFCDLRGGCLAPGCGNDIVEDDEICDDGNTEDGDGCSADCSSSGLCGNSLLDRGEICDDGNAEDGDGCSADCLSDETCGNGVNDPGEICDDGNTEDGDGCSADCLSDEPPADMPAD